MNNQEITGLLNILLIIGICILFVLIIIFIFTSIISKSKKKREESLKKESNIETQRKSKETIAKVYTKEDIKKFMDFDDIKDNMIVTKNGKRFVMVVGCQGINYDLMSAIEKNSVERGFVQFLNTLNRPIQIYIQSRKVNLEESLANYRKKLDDIERRYNRARIEKEQLERNEDISLEQKQKSRLEYFRLKNLLEYAQDIINNTEKMSLNKNILTKNYYIVIYYYVEDNQDLFGEEEIADMAFSELYTNAQAMIRTLAVCDIQARILDSEELSDLLYVAYNRDDSDILSYEKAKKAGYDSMYTTGKDVIQKRIEILDKLIQEKAMEEANNAVQNAILKSRKELEEKEKEENMKKLIKRMAKTIIYENQNYIEPNISEMAIEEIDKKEIKKTKKTKTRR